MNTKRTVAIGALALAAVAGSALYLMIHGLPGSSEIRPLGGPVDIARVALSQRGFLGIELDSEASGTVFIRNVFAGSGAADAGLLPGDIVIAVGGERVSSVPDVQDRVGTKQAGAVVSLLVRRGDEEIPFDVRLISSAEMSAARHRAP